MFKKVRIQSFRQFKDLTLDNLAQINLITGANNTGKTSLMEALFLLANPTDPEKVLTIAQLRGIESVVVSGRYGWGFIFHDGDASAPIVLSGLRTDGSREQLRIRISDDLEASVASDEHLNGAAGQPVVSTATAPLAALEYVYEASSDSDLRRGGSRIRVSDRQRTTERAVGFTSRPFYFLAQGGPADAEADAERFSRLVEARRKHEVIEALRLLEPRLTDLEVLALRPSTVTADLGSGPLVPVGYMGRGFERLLMIVLAVLVTPGGIVMLDEIEDGLHYSALPNVWKVIISTAIANGVQIVATTHSLEAINAAVEGSEDHEGSLAFYRLERRKDDIAVVAGEDWRLRTAVSVGTELR